MISCREIAAATMSDQLETLSWWKRMEVRMHLAMCGFCSRLVRQIGMLRRGVRQLSEREDADPGFEDRVIRRLTMKRE